MATSARTPLLVGAIFALTAAALTGCVWPSTPSSTYTSLSSPTDSPTATVTPSPTPTAGTPAQPISIACSTLVSPQTMYDFNPNFTLQAAYAPKSGTFAYTAAADGGTACNWVNDTSGETLVVSVARPGSIEFASLKSSAAQGTPVSGYGDAAYFSSGRLDVFSGDYWLVTQSSQYSTANDASAIAKSALAQLH
ncbi:MAG: hypothetical protein V4479_15845 [Actinomycetota bacterium]